MWASASSRRLHQSPTHSLTRVSPRQSKCSGQRQKSRGYRTSDFQITLLQTFHLSQKHPTGGNGYDKFTRFYFRVFSLSVSLSGTRRATLRNAVAQSTLIQSYPVGKMYKKGFAGLSVPAGALRSTVGECLPCSKMFFFSTTCFSR